jgi:hypothetical protein
MVSVVGWDMRENRLVPILLKKGARRRIINIRTARGSGL